MKTLGMTAAVLLVATLTFAQTAEKRPMAAKPAASPMADKLMANENKLLDTVRAKDMKTFGTMVVKGSWSVDENGYMTTDDFIKAVGDPKADFKVDMLKASDMKVVEIGADSAIVTYKVDEKGTFMGQPMAPVVYATTVWVLRGGAWKAIFHQESTAKPMAKK